MEFVAVLVGFLGFSFRGTFCGGFCSSFSGTSHWFFDKNSLIRIVSYHLTIGTRLIVGNFERTEIFVFEILTNFRLEEEFQ